MVDWQKIHTLSLRCNMKMLPMSSSSNHSSPCNSKVEGEVMIKIH